MVSCGRWVPHRKEWNERDNAARQGFSGMTDGDGAFPWGIRDAVLKKSSIDTSCLQVRVKLEEFEDYNVFEVRKEAGVARE